MSRLAQRMDRVERDTGEKRVAIAVSYWPPDGSQELEDEVRERHCLKHPEDRKGAEIIVVYTHIPDRKEGDLE